MKFLQVIAMLAGIASATVALVSYFGVPGSAKRGGAAPASSAPAGQPHSSPSPSPAPSPSSGPAAGSHNPGGSGDKGSGSAGGNSGNQKK